MSPALGTWVLLVAFSPVNAQTAAPPLVDTVATELERIHSHLSTEDDPPHWMAVGVTTTESVSFSASNGVTTEPYRSRSRLADIDVRVGTPELDSTHKIRDAGWFDDDGREAISLPLNDADGDAIRKAIWRGADDAYRHARKRLLKVKNNLAVKVASEDRSGDFSPSEAVQFMASATAMGVDEDALRIQLRDASRRFLASEVIEDSNISINAVQSERIIVTTEGTRLRLPRSAIRLGVWARTTAPDGMDINVYESVDVTHSEDLPADAALGIMVSEVIARVEALAAAPVVEPTAAPAILRGRAAAVFFHEVLGHRIEGHRQKDDDEGKTFTDKVGQPILPAFISVIDDPTATHNDGVVLNGHYTHDDEGVPSQATVIVDKGVLTDFLTSRSPIEATPRSNGHGRRQVGNAVVARQGNLMVRAHRSVSYASLRRALLAELRRQGKPFGFIVDDITGGFTFTGRVTPNAFAVQTVGIHRVWADGTPDELMRGADLIGTPLTTFNQIIAASDTESVFNGSCGAESGWVPVSATAPDLLIREIEVQRSEKQHDRPPILPAPKVSP